MPTMCTHNTHIHNVIHRVWSLIPICLEQKFYLCELIATTGHPGITVATHLLSSRVIMIQEVMCSLHLFILSNSLHWKHDAITLNDDV